MPTRCTASLSLTPAADHLTLSLALILSHQLSPALTSSHQLSPALTSSEPVRTQVDQEETPLYVACEKGQLEVARYLVETAGVAAQGFTPVGRFALYGAAKNGHLEVNAADSL